MLSINRKSTILISKAEKIRKNKEVESEMLPLNAMKSKK